MFASRVCGWRFTDCDSVADALMSVSCDEFIICPYLHLHLPGSGVHLSARLPYMYRTCMQRTHASTEGLGWFVLRDCAIRWRAMLLHTLLQGDVTYGSCATTRLSVRSVPTHLQTCIAVTVAGTAASVSPRPVR